MISRRVILGGTILAALPSTAQATASFRTAILWDALARRDFTYKDDGPWDRWTSHADDVLAGKAWRDDCDGLTSTVLDLLARDGWPETHLMRALVLTEGGKGHFDHMVGLAVDRNGQVLVVGDTGGGPYLVADMKHRMFTALPYDCWSYQP